MIYKCNRCGSYSNSNQEGAIHHSFISYSGNCKNIKLCKRKQRKSTKRKIKCKKM